MKGLGFSAVHRRGSRWMALALLPLLTGCLGAVAIPLVTGGGLSLLTRHRVRAATAVPKPAHDGALKTPRARQAVGDDVAEKATLTSLKELPPPTAVEVAPVDDRWQRFFAYTMDHRQLAGTNQQPPQAALLVANPSIEAPARRNCPQAVPAVVIDLDDDPAPFDPGRVASAPPALAQGLAHLREAGVVVLWITRLPSARVSDVAQALKRSGLDPQGQDQLLLVRGPDDRKQLLRADANNDVCVVAIAGEQRGDFDELFDYLRNPDAAIGLDLMMDNGWFLVPSLEMPSSQPAAPQAPAAPSTDR